MADSDGDMEIPEPINVEYCSVCTMPYEFCSFSATPDRCKAAAPDGGNAAEGEDTGDVVDDDGGDEGAAEGEGKKKRQTRGGKGLATKAAKKQQAKSPTVVTITLTTRNKRKFVTIISGLASFGIDLKQASKKLAGRLAASASISGEDEISVTGDHTADIADVMAAKFKEIPEDKIVFKKAK
eukprot:m.19676 g.19676  ORF g.19676 m.19676 type:complete len:182 (-) comp6645_c0_seq1:652-1197(-)